MLWRRSKQEEPESGPPEELRDLLTELQLAQHALEKHQYIGMRLPALKACSDVLDYLDTHEDPTDLRIWVHHVMLDVRCRE